jgi:hypothetical protein
VLKSRNPAMPVSARSLPKVLGLGKPNGVLMSARISEESVLWNGLLEEETLFLAPPEAGRD